MGINLTEIAQQLTNTIQNGANVVKRLFDLHYNPTPLDVELPWIDENGKLTTYKIPNNAKNKKNYLDIIGAAIAKMSVTYYVDAKNGDDLNPGTQEAPFKTFEKAVNSVPFGGRGVINVVGDYYIKGSENRVNIYQKFIKIIGAETGNEKLTLEYDETVCFGVYDNSFLILALDIDLKNSSGETVIKNIITQDNSSDCVVVNNYRKTVNEGTTQKTKLNYVDDYISLSYVRRSKIDFFYTDISKNGYGNIALFQIGFSAIANFGFGTIDGDNFSVDNIKPLVQNIVYDADSGNPINLLCNYNLSN